MEYNIHSDAIGWRISTSTKVIAWNFTLALTVSEILKFEMSDLENLGQGQNTTAAMVLFDGEYQPLQKLYVSIFC